MPGLLRGYAVLTLCGWAAFPILGRAFGRTPDRGYALCRCFGWMLSAWLAWMLAWAGGRALTTPLALGAILAIGALSWLPLLVARRRQVRLDLRPRAGLIIWIEGLFLAGVLLFGFLQKYNPAIDPDSERFMDYAYLKSSLRSRGLPIQDPWMAGQETVYYHFGYAMVGFLLRACGAEPGGLFTAAVVLCHALVWIGAFHVGVSLTGRARGGLLAAFLVLGAGNLGWVRQGFDWFASSRIIDGTITEFPWFSLLWGDLHPYVIALPIGICALAFPLAGAIEGLCGSPSDPKAWGVVGFALAAGAALAVHPWDFPMVVGTALVLEMTRRRSPAAPFLLILLAGAVAILLFLPFLKGPATGARGFGWVEDRSALWEWLMAYGPFVLIATLAVPWLFFSRRWSPADRAEEGGSVRLAAALAACGLLTALVGELVYVRDLFESTPLLRMNTVFKLHRFAWLLLAFASSVFLDRLARAGRARSMIRLSVWVALAASLVYPVLGTASWLRARHAEQERETWPPSRAALGAGAGAEDLFRTRFPGDAAAAAYIAARAGPKDAVLEETGDPYTWSARISTFSGVPAVLGWGNHEAVWRQSWDEVLRRSSDVSFMYTHWGSRESCDRLREYGVVWIVVGERERQRYGPIPRDVGRTFRPALDVEGTAVYRAAELCGESHDDVPR